MKAALCASVLVLIYCGAGEAKAKCVVIPYQSATQDEGGWTVDKSNSASVWINNRNVRRARGTVTKLCGRTLWVPKGN